MNFFGKAYARSYQTIMKCCRHFMKYREPQILENLLDIKDILLNNNLNHPLIISSESITKLKLYSPMVKDLKANSIKVTIFDEVQPNPTIECCETAYNLYLDKKCDSIIAIGGGSVIDCAKIVGARVSNPNKSIIKMKGLLKIKNPPPTLFAIPTTAGTGSEVTMSAVITDSNTHTKFIITDFDLIPHYAILDENLTATLPPAITAYTGMDALTHAIESFISNSTTPESRHNSLEACRLVFDNIQKVYDDGQNLRARKNMLKASYQAGLGFRVAYVGYVHAVAHTLGGKYGTHHGLANAVILPYMLSLYGHSIHDKLKKIAVYCNIARPYESAEQASNKLINKIFEINEYMGIPKKFDFIHTEDIHSLSKLASNEANPLYPVPKLLNSKELEKIYFQIQA